MIVSVAAIFSELPMLLFDQSYQIDYQQSESVELRARCATLQYEPHDFLRPEASNSFKIGLSSTRIRAPKHYGGRVP